MAEYTYVNKILNLGLDSCLAPLASGKFVQTVCSSVLLSAAIPSYLFNFREKKSPKHEAYFSVLPPWFLHVGERELVQ